MAARDGLAGNLDRDDALATAKLLALVAILFLLPDRPLELLFGVNLRRAWFVVVGVAGLSFVGYLFSKIVDPTAAIGAAGALGGLVSPGLAITSLLEQENRAPAFSEAYAFAAAAAVTMLFPRNLVVVALVDPGLAASLAVPFSAMAVVAATVATGLWRRSRARQAPASEMETPFRLRAAFLIGGVVAILLAVVDHTQLTVSSETSRLGIVLVTLLEMGIYTTVTAAAGARGMAKAVGAILAGSAVLGLSLVLFT